MEKNQEVVRQIAASRKARPTKQVHIIKVAGRNIEISGHRTGQSRASLTAFYARRGAGTWKPFNINDIDPSMDDNKMFEVYDDFTKSRSAHWIRYVTERFFSNVPVEKWDTILGYKG